MNKVKNYLKGINLEKFVSFVKMSPVTKEVSSSVIIVTFEPDINLFLDNIQSLENQTFSDFEIIIVDNSKRYKNLLRFVKLHKNISWKYIHLKDNYGLSIARNIGAIYSKGKILIFLDDDAIPATNLVESHLEAYKKYDIFGLRGRCFPRTHKIFNYFASHYDLGDSAFPYFINLEGNSSFLREIFMEVGGFNSYFSGAGGHEGLEISYRIIKLYGDFKKLIYYPFAVIYHDYSNSFKKYMYKQLRHRKNSEFLRTNYPEILNFIKVYSKFRNQHYNPIDHRLNFIQKIQLKFINIITKFFLKVMLK